MPSGNQSPTGSRRWSRRAFLSVATGGAVALAGCSSRDQSRRTDAATTEASTLPTSERETDERECVAGERHVGSASVDVDGAWPQFQDGPGNAGSTSDDAGPTDPGLAWRYATCSRLGESPPVVAGGSVYVGGDALRAFDATTGEEEWVDETATSWTAPAVDGDTVYFAGRDVTAFDGDDGTVLWRDERESDILARGSPTLVDGTLYVPGAVDDPSLRAFDAATGEQRWARRISETGVPGPPVVGGGRLYVVEAGAVYALTTDGELVWRQPTGAFELGLPVYADGTLYVGGTPDSPANTGEPTGLVAALDGADGSQQWSYRTRGYRNERRRARVGTAAPVAVTDGAVFAATNAGDVLALG